jgi:hypothetical protein
MFNRKNIPNVFHKKVGPKIKNYSRTRYNISEKEIVLE